jgi:urease accessory protein UreE
VSTRFGSSAVIKADDIEAFIAAARHALGNETADVILRIDDLEFASGHDLETFLQKLGIDPAPGEVEQ